MVAPPSRRRFPRVPSRNLVLVTTVGDADAEQLARTSNVSLGGCQVEVDRQLHRGTLVQVLIRVEDQVVDALARVVYELRRGAKVEAGVEFVYLSEGDRRLLETLLAGERPAGDRDRRR